MNDLIQNNYMREYVRRRQDEDREEYLDSQIRAVKPIFKNFVDNNTNIVRREMTLGKLKELKERQEKE
jgi:hypothetical protein